jgi:superfamily II DNA or RNA helicase
MSELRPYQSIAVSQIEDALDRSSSVLFQLATGAGKTLIAAEIIERAITRGERVLCLTHRIEILKQTSLKLQVEHGLVQAGLTFDLDHPVKLLQSKRFTLVQCGPTKCCCRAQTC